MSTLKMIATVAYIIICIALVIVVLMQEGKTSGLGALSGAADSYWSKNKGRSQEGMLHQSTCRIICCIIGSSLYFMVRLKKICL